MTTTTKTTLDAALAYKAAGFEVIPDHPTAKYPQGIAGWETRDFKEAELTDYIGGKGWGIGLRNQEGLDFDNKGDPNAETLFYDWAMLVNAQAPGLVDRLAIETTPSGGYHAFYKCDEIEGNLKLATRPPTPEEKAKAPKATQTTLIETRGAGGQFMVSPSPGYVLIQGDILSLPTITPAERRILLDCARALDRSPRQTITHQNGNSTDDRPGDYYNAEYAGEALDMLKDAGWQIVSERNGSKYLRRPGKDRGISATWGAVGPDVFYNFSSNASPFESGASYNPFAIFTTLKHSGDFKAAARELAHRFGTNGSQAAPLLAMQNEDDAGPIFERLTTAELLTRPPKVWLIDNLIGQQDLIMVFGDAGSGKTFVTLDIIAAAALGKPAIETYHTTRPLTIAYCAGEGLAGLAGRIAALLNKYRLKPDDLALDFFTDVPQLFEPDVEKNIYAFVRELSALNKQYDLIVIDTLHAASVGADENHAKDVGVILQAMKYTRNLLGCSVALVHHANKAGGYRGSSALHGAMDTMLQTRMDGEGFGTLETFKQKDAPQAAPLYFRLKGEPVSQSAYVEWLEKTNIDLNEQPGRPSEIAKDVIIELLQQKPGLNQSQIVKGVKEETLTNIGRAAIRNALDELENEGVLMVEVGARGAKIYQLSF